MALKVEPQLPVTTLNDYQERHPCRPKLGQKIKNNIELVLLFKKYSTTLNYNLRSTSFILKDP